MIGRYPELTATAAQIEAGELRAKIPGGHDPMEERNQRRGEPTLGDLGHGVIACNRMDKAHSNSFDLSGAHANAVYIGCASGIGIERNEAIADREKVLWLAVSLGGPTRLEGAWGS